MDPSLCRKINDVKNFRFVAALALLTSVLAFNGCSELKLSNNKVSESHAGQDGYDVTHEVKDRHSEHQSGAVGPAESQGNEQNANGQPSADSQDSQHRSTAETSQPVQPK